jgi:sarcosine oxidase
MPTIAYLDTGIYCHPIVEGLVDAVKIGYYDPPDLPRPNTPIDSIATFVDECMPGLRTATIRDVDDVDQCDYDLVADDDFVLGAVPGFANAFVGVGSRGTGYKFAPWVGRVLAELALQAGTGWGRPALRHVGRRRRARSARREPPRGRAQRCETAACRRP